MGSCKLKKYKPTKFIAKGAKYDREKADFAVEFISCLSHTKGQWAGQPFELMSWQEEIIRGLFGTIKANGYRQFNMAYISVAKKNGKSELAAAVALLLLCGDGEERAEIYSCAADRQQASIVFNVAADMVRNCPALNKRCKILGSTKRIIYKPTNSIYQVLSAEAYTKHGLNVSGVIFDELHAQPNRNLFDVMTKGSGDARTQPLYFLITTAGNNTNSICYEIHQKALDILEGRKKDSTFYPVIYGASEEEDWTEPEIWRKANPSLGVTIEIEKVKAACQAAQMNPAEENFFRQLRLNQWTKQEQRWLSVKKWDACEVNFDERELEGRICCAGLDLSSTTDLTALVLIFPPTDAEEKYFVIPYFWLPEETIELRSRRDHVLYETWAKKGLFQVTQGNVADYGAIEKFILGLTEKYQLESISYDRWNATQLSQNLEREGLTMIQFGQGIKLMNAPTKEFERLVLEKKIAHNGHAVLRWNVDNLIVEKDAAGNIKPSKKKATEKIDGCVALIMALDRAIRINGTHASVYETRGLIFISTTPTIESELVHTLTGLYRVRDSNANALS